MQTNELAAAMNMRIDPDSFGFLINDVSRQVRAEVDRLITEAGLGLTPGEARVLTNAARSGSVRQTVLADRIGVEPMTLCAYVDRLEAQGLIRRSVDPSDRRAKLVHLTGDADDILRRLSGIGVEIRRLAAADITADEWATLQALLKKVRSALGRERAGTAQKGNAA
jgi:MarR family transcriptional regulator for hemolysin